MVRCLVSQEELDVLMKFIYRGMAEPDEERCKGLLAWHAAVRRYGPFYDCSPRSKLTQQHPLPGL
jgi:hypothetical protein